MGEIYDKSIELHEISKSGKKCCVGVGHKIAAQAWKTENLERSEALQYSVLAKKYKPGHGMPFKIYEPKVRDILPPLFRDRVWQNNLCRNGVYDAFTKPLIYDCGACRRDMGTEFSLLRMVAALEKFYRKYGDNIGYARHLDIRKYFPSTPQKESIKVIDRYVKDDIIAEQLKDIFYSFIDNRPQDVIEADEFGKRGTGLGSPVSQLVQLAMLCDLDQRMVRDKSIDAYQRTMDDIIIITRTKEAADRAEEVVRDFLKNLGLEMTDKGGNNKLGKGFYYLKKKFILTGTGKTLVIPQRQKFEKERRVLRKHKEMLDKGTITMDEIQNRYECWISTMLVCDCGARIHKMDLYFKELFGVMPIYKCIKKSKRRIAYV